MPTVEINGFETYYERQGDGVPLVFVHGSGWDHRQWSPQVETLSSSYEVITYDVSGHGHSESSPRKAVTFEDRADDLQALIDTLDLDAPVIIGCSMGGRIAYEYAAKYPRQLRGLVTLEASPPSFDCPGWQIPLRRLGVEVTTRIGPLRVWEFKQWLTSLRGNDSETDDETMVRGLELTDQEYFDSAKARCDSGELASGMRGNYQLLISENDAPSFEQITKPALILTGETGPDIFERAAETLANRISNSQRRTIPDGGHAANIDNPEDFNDVVESFVAGTIETDSSTV